MNVFHPNGHLRPPTVVAGSSLLPESLSELTSFARVVANSETEPWSMPRLRRAAAEADGLIAFMPDRIDAAFLEGCPNLQVIAGALKGADNIDQKACADRGIAITVVEDLLSLPTAELGIGLLLGLLRHVLAGDRRVRDGHPGWTPTLYGGSVVNADIGILGMGSVGQAFAGLLRCFSARLTYHDPFRLAEERERALGLKWVPAEALSATCATALVLAAPLTTATRCWLDSEQIARLPPGSVVVNIGRASVADEEAILAALGTGALGGYAADVFAFEDLSRADRPRAIPAGLLKHPRTLFTPHLGSAVRASRLAIERSAIAALRNTFSSDVHARSPRPDPC